MPSIKSLIGGLFRRHREESEMADELRFHLESRAEHLERLGMSASEARRTAQLEFGGVESYKERCREARGHRIWDEIRSDLQFTFRTLKKAPGFTVTAVLSLALSIGVNLSCFAALYSMVLHPFAYANLERIMMLSDVRAKSADRNPVAVANFLEWKRRNTSFEYLAAFREWNANLSRVDHPDHVRAALATAELFSVLGIHPIIGRTFTASECQPGRDGVVVVSYGFWQTRLGASRDVAHTAISLDGRTYTIVGVMPREFNLPLGSEFWTPLAFTKQETANRQTQQLSVIGKLRPDVTRQQAAVDLDKVAQQLAQEYPRTNESHDVVITTLTDTMTSENGHFLSVLMCAALFVLLLGSINVGSLQLARAMSRQKEIGLRRALGANGSRIFRQLLTENLVIAFLGGMAGIALAAWHLNVIRANIPASIFDVAAGLKEMRMNADVALYGLALSLVAGVLCCLPAAFEITRSNRSGDLNDVLKEGGRSSQAGSGRRKLRTVLVVGEVALAFVLLVGAGLMVGTLHKILALNLGYDTNNLLTGRVSLSSKEYDKPARAAAFYETVLRDLNRSGDLEAGAVLSDLDAADSVIIEGREEAHPGELRPNLHATSPQYLKATKLPLIFGRWISEQDRPSTPQVVVLSTSVVQHYWPHGGALGQRIRFGSDAPWLTVVGVTGDVKDWFLQRPEPAAYVSYRQFPPSSVQFLLRGRHDSRILATTLRTAIQAQDSRQPLYQVHTVAEQMHEETTGIRNAASMMGDYAAIALMLAVTGIYSISSFFVMQRKPDIAIRMSLGATHQSILRMVLGQSCRLAGWGLAIGVPLAILLTIGMSRALFGIVPVQPNIFLTFVLILSGAAVLAGYIPAYRATRVDPVTALRQQ